MLFGPTGGYILVALTIIAFALGNVIIYAFGLPFLFGDLLKIESELTGYHP
jgi:Mn2+/Fe2+ NRAMP family transporter